MMLDFQQKRKVRAFLYHRITLGVLLVLVLVILHSTWVVYQKREVSEDMKNVSLKQEEELRLRSEDLTSRIERLSTVSGIEEEIRAKFTVAKDKENMVVVVDGGGLSQSTTTQQTGFWHKILNLFYK